MLVRIALTLIAAVALSGGAAYAQSRQVDPTKVAPEFRDAAEKRAAEQRKLAGCHKEADAQKVSPRDRSKFIVACIEK